MSETGTNFNQVEAHHLNLQASSKKISDRVHQSNEIKSIETHFLIGPKQSNHASKKDQDDQHTKKKKLIDTYVQHDYHDYSICRYEDIPTNSLSHYQQNHRGGNDMLFPQKLHDVLHHAEEENLDIISWAPHGRCFTVNNREMFRKKYLVPNFQMKTFASFQRQLNRYDFKSITKYISQDKGAYYHELFLRGRPHLSRIMRRRRNKGNGFKPLSNPQDEPNFYSFPSCYDVNHELEVKSQAPLQCDVPVNPITSDPVEENKPHTSASVDSYPSTFVSGGMVRFPIFNSINQPIFCENFPRVSVVNQIIPIPVMPLVGVLELPQVQPFNQNHVMHVANVPFHVDGSVGPSIFNSFTENK